MTKRKPNSAKDPECAAKEYEKLPPCTTSEQSQPEAHDHDTIIVKPGESPKHDKKRKRRPKLIKRGKKKLNINDDDAPEIAVLYKPEPITLDKLQKDVDEVVEIVRVNVEGILVREGNVEELEAAADNLHIAALEFKKTGRGVLLKYWWRNNRRCVCILLFIILVVSIGLAVGLAKRFRTQNPASPVPIMNVTTEPLSNVSTSFMPIRVNGTSDLWLSQLYKGINT